MRRYKQFCPVAKAAELFCERWTALIVRDLAGGDRRFSQLRRGVPLMSPSMLSARLKQLQAEGVIEHRPAPSGRGGTYGLTAAGREFIPLVEALGRWGQRWSRRKLEEDEIDLGLLIWSLESGVDASAFGGQRTVVRLELTDQPSDKVLWWFVNEAGGCELCLEDPGHEVGLYLACTLPTMIYIVRGDLTVARAVAEDRLEVMGPARLRTALTRWLNLSPLAQIAPQNPARAAF